MADVRIVEVGPRDGLQNFSASIPTAIKLELVQKLRDSGLQSIELTSIVSSKAVPQLSDCRQVMSSPAIQEMLRDSPHVKLPVLVPNIKGLRVALEHGIREVAVFVSATEGFSRANTNCTVAEGFERARVVAKEAISHGLAVRGYVSCIFADPYSGPTPLEAVYDAVKVLFDVGCYEVSLGDTLGGGTAPQVRKLFHYLFSRGISPRAVAGHFHDTYGQALANVWEAYQQGVRVFDSSVGGLGGCPFAPGAKGNVATEDVVYLFKEAGIDTGVDLTSLAATGSWISHNLDKLNDSRVGAALATRSSQSSSLTHAQNKLSWTLIRKTGCLLLYRSGTNVKIVLNRPEKGSNLSQHLVKDLSEAFHDLEKEKSITRITIAGEGRHLHRHGSW
ncbi:Hydroxymethylglutaryl-CoA lyase [Paramyrothecium foliicola]|nr:Hydroxymethylglutaryl-CoA lyase [Paramyrothecium foliicola]